MEKEKYVPSAKEVSKAENSMMGGQEELSKKRERLRKSQELLGIKMLERKKINIQHAGQSFESEEVKGEIKGHKVFLEKNTNLHDDSLTFFGTVDDKRLANVDAKKLWEKYSYAALDTEAEDEAIRKSNVEIEEAKQRNSEVIRQQEISRSTAELLKDLLE